MEKENEVIPNIFNSIDKVINNVCKYINEDIENDKVDSLTVDMIDALAKFITARAE